MKRALVAAALVLAGAASANAETWACNEPRGVNAGPASSGKFEKDSYDQKIALFIDTDKANVRWYRGAPKNGATFTGVVMLDNETSVVFMTIERDENSYGLTTYTLDRETKRLYFSAQREQPGLGARISAMTTNCARIGA